MIFIKSENGHFIVREEGVASLPVGAVQLSDTERDELSAGIKIFNGTSLVNNPNPRPF